jgi:hypothetical protein
MQTFSGKLEEFNFSTNEISLEYIAKKNININSSIPLLTFEKVVSYCTFNNNSLYTEMEKVWKGRYITLEGKIEKVNKQSSIYKKYFVNNEYGESMYKKNNTNFRGLFTLTNERLRTLHLNPLDIIILVEEIDFDKFMKNKLEKIVGNELLDKKVEYVLRIEGKDSIIEENKDFFVFTLMYILCDPLENILKIDFNSEIEKKKEKDYIEIMRPSQNNSSSSSPSPSQNNSSPSPAAPKTSSSPPAAPKNSDESDNYIKSFRLEKKK